MNANKQGVIPTTKSGQRQSVERVSRVGSPSAAGAMLFAVGVIAGLAITTAEALYPGYSTSHNAISDLGSGQPPQGLVAQPSAAIFNTSMIVCGVLVILAAFFLYRSFRSLAVSIPVGLFGVGVLGVGVFPASYGDFHAGFAGLLFVAGAVAAILAYKVETGPFRYFSVVLGAVAFVVMVLYIALGDASPFARLGPGAEERWVAYPILLWVTGFGGHLLGRR